MSKGRKNQGFALIAALGVLATIFIMVGTVAITARVLYERAGNEKVRSQLSLFSDSGLEKVRLDLRKQEITEPREKEFKLGEAKILARVEPLMEKSELYSTIGLSYMGGDIKTTIAVDYYLGDYIYKQERTYLINLKGARKGSILLSQKFLGAEEK